MEERRAMLACFMLSSVMSQFFAKTETLRWTPHLDESLDMLSTSPNSFDRVLFNLVRFHLIRERATGASYSDKVPPSHYLTALRSQLNDVKRSVSPESQHGKN
jgi:hypothetical protein